MSTKNPGEIAKEIEEDDLEDPEVGFSITIASDIHPDTICDWIRPEWKKNGRKRLYVKELRTHNPKHAMVLYEFFNKSNVDTIAAEAKMLLNQAREEEMLESMDYFKWKGMEIPPLGVAV